MLRLALVLSALALSAPTLAAQVAAPAAQQPVPEISIREPRDGATVPRTFTLVFGLKNWGVAPASVNFPRTGHFHVLINTDAGAPGTVIPADSLHRHFGTGAIETTLTLAPGSYTLRAVLGDHEHKVISRELVSAPIRITVR
ncbi:MAG: hypothetical protein C0503_04435 [Gemmatimonas sp.]|nr:hypothetical protein [Gemmatimonas sp.]